MPPASARAIFSLRDDLTNTLPEANDRPGQQRWNTLDVNKTPDNPYDDAALARDYAGSYTWFATIRPTSFDALLGMQPTHPRYGSFEYEVSVAVMYKRDGAPGVDTERMLEAELNLGGALTVYAQKNDYDAVDAASQDIRAGQWVLIAGQHPVTGQFLMKWYRLLAFDDETTENVNVALGNGVAARQAMLENVEVDDPFIRDVTAPPASYRGLRAILLPGVIGVATQTLELETD
jgi:hypothetical protein